MAATAKRKIDEGPADGEPDTSTHAHIIPLGAGSEVGRSCIIFKYQDKTVMFDCGIHPAFKGMDSLPLLDEIDIDTVDVALITHFHLDHCAAVPYLLRKTRFKGRIFMTHPTKAIYYSLLRDLAKGSKHSSEEALFNEDDLEASMQRIEVVDFYQTIEVAGMQITPYRAGHVLGAAMFLVEVAGCRCLYTGDYSRLPDRHLPAADIPPVKPHIVIVESTYGTSRHLPRLQREQLLLDTIRNTINRGGRVIMPVVALGRAQELLLLLDEYWEAHKSELSGIPIYQASSMMSKALGVYQTYVESLNDDIKRVFHERNPFKFRHVQTLKNPAHFISDYSGPCVIMATPSGLQSGASRDFFEAWCEDSRNTCIICDFAVQGTLAKEILGGPSSITTREGRRVPLRIAVHNISFSAHADYDQTSGFLDAVRPPHVVLVHGEYGEMRKLAKALKDGAKAAGVAREVYTPILAQTVAVEHKPDRSVRLQGRLGEKPPREGAAVRGVLVRQGGGFATQLLAPSDLPRYTKLLKGSVTQRQAISVDVPFTAIRLALEVMFEGVEGAGTLPVATAPDAEGGKGGESLAVVVGELVTVRYVPADDASGVVSHVVLEWEGGRQGDMVADAVVAVVLQSIGEPPEATSAESAMLAARAAGDEAAAAAAELHLIGALLRGQFGPAAVDEAGGLVRLDVDGVEAAVDYRAGKVVCGEPGLRARIEKSLDRLAAAIRPAPLDRPHD
ncbi:hypothetical protein CHLRE_12g498050v5 [Chlamydomonas reinhardtii]|uniref:Cleavage and polyadenylation specificity factor n=1 Tax=Chlamydomonas reinhardtii TaxID=3055 RepID=A0A2K3D3G0_CHLRE|nr:uncharacterized protein CHLRE_12g498050v5 [Chlamydomonas reinhardtii]PNW75066.1 hypothetical protein CHLRE_12g498050v5 [Chlamydomonas reinhardtii]